MSRDFNVKLSCMLAFGILVFGIWYWKLNRERIFYTFIIYNMSVKWHRLNILKQKYDVSCHVYLDGDRTRQFTGGGRRVWGCGGAADVLHPGKRILMHYNVSQCITIKCRTIRCMTM